MKPTHKERADFGFRPATEQERAEAYVREKCPDLIGEVTAGSYRKPADKIQLHHWLRALGDNGLYLVSTNGHLHKKITGGFEEAFDFNLANGQPASLEDYQAFNQIVYGN